MRINIPFIGGTLKSRSIAVNDQETVNFMQGARGRGAKAPVVLETVPGLVDLATVGDGPIRTSQMVSSGIRGAGNDLYGVWGSKLIVQSPSTGNAEIGTLNSTAGRVRMARGRNFIAMVDGTDGYTYNGTTLAQISDLDFPSNPTHIVYQDGFFIVNDSETDNFYISALEDPTSWNALDFDAASVAPDNALAIASANSLLWILGDETAQAYYNSGNIDFPFEIVLSATQEVGILAPDSVAESDEGIFYLASTPEGGRFVYQIRGQAGQVITGNEEDNLLNDIVSPSEAYGFIYKQAGKSFYVLQIGEVGGDNPKSSMTMVYNIGAASWETRELQDGTAWRAGGHGILNNRNIVGSRLQNRQLELKLDNYQDSGQELIRRRRTQIYHSNNHLMDWWEVVVDAEGGIGLTNDGEPLVYLRYSDIDGEWSNFLQGSFGTIGNSQQRIVFHNLGQSRNRKFEIVTSANAKVTIIGAYAVVSVLQD